MQASCTPDMKVSTQILRPISFVHLANQTGGILHSPPTPTQGGSSSSTLVMTTSLVETPHTSISVCEEHFVVSFNKENNITNNQPSCQAHVILLILVLVHFYPWFKFYLSLFFFMLTYDNEYETKENKN